MPVEAPVQIAPVFFGVWVVLGLFSAGFFLFSKNAKLKRRLWPPCVVVAGVLFIAFALAMGEELDALYLMVPAVVVMALLNLRAVKFCDACGTTIVNRNPLSRPEFCSKCGTRLAQ